MANTGIYVAVRGSYGAITGSTWRLLPRRARSQGGGGGGGGRPPQKKMPKKGERDKKKKRKIKLRVCMWSCRLSNHFQSKIKYNFVLYEENTGHMHQIAPLTTSKCKKLSLWEGGHLPPPPPLARSARSGSVASLPSHVIFLTAPPKIKSWLRHCCHVKSALSTAVSPTWRVTSTTLVSAA